MVPASTSAISARLDARDVVPVSSASRNRDACSRRDTFTKCCSARISVGAMNATCRPFSIATRADSSATMVLPAPTSPCSRRFIGCGFCRSSTISFERVLLPGGQLERQDAPRRLADPIVHLRHDRLALLGDGLPPRGNTGLKQKRFLEDEPLLRRRREPVQRVDRRVGGRECAAISAA